MTTTTLEPRAPTTATESMPEAAPAITATPRKLVMRWSVVDGRLTPRWGHRPS